MKLKKIIKKSSKKTVLLQTDTLVSIPHSKRKRLIFSFFWFGIGFFFAAAILSSILLLYFQNTYKDRVIPGIFIDNLYVGEKTKSEIENIFNNKNALISQNQFELASPNLSSTISAKTLNIGYNSKLIAEQAASIGKSPNLFTNLYLTIHSYLNGTYLEASYTYNPDILKEFVEPIKKKIYIEPIDALFTVENNRVLAFKESQDGQTIDYDFVERSIREKIPTVIRTQKAKVFTVQVPIKVLEPHVTTEKANKFGIVEVIGTGVSHYAHSIPNRIYNINLAATKINGILVAPNEEFSFVKYLGDVSKLTGYKEAYVIQNGKTILGDGGGVCQVSTTLFRALLNAGVPITERHPHSYRVGYYEQQSKPGLDATVFYPSVDLQFKNDTGNHILIQSSVDPVNLSLTFTLWGKKDGRESSITTPVITSQSAPPPPSYQDDPTLAKGEVKQVDFEAWGAHVVFKRTVKKDGKVIIDETFNTRYSPWQAVFLRGTKEG